MEKNKISKAGTFVLVFMGIFLVIRYLFPIILPFLIGFAIAAASMPVSRFLQERLHIPRALACFLGVTAVLVLAAGILGVLCALGYRELSTLAGLIPDAVRRLTDQVSGLRQWLLELTRRLPAGVGAAAEQAVAELFTNGSVLLDKAASGLMGAIAAIVGGLPGGAMLLGTAVISGYMIAAQMPAIRRRVGMSPLWRERIAPVTIVGGLPGGAMLLGTAVISGYMIAAQMPAIRRRVGMSPLWRERIAPVTQRLRQSVFCWLRAQVKLAGITFAIVWAGLLLLRTRYSFLWAVLIAVVITFAIVWAGLLLLRTRYSFLWAVLIAVVDAVPMLGTGTILIPWAVLLVLQGQWVRAVGMAGIYLAAMLIRSAMEPKLVGMLGTGTILIPWAVLLVLQGQWVRAVGMAGIYLAAMLIRSAMEPKLVGQHLGLNPLVTLAALYAGYRLWGVMGMILSPILAITASQLASAGKGDLNC